MGNNNQQKAIQKLTEHNKFLDGKISYMRNKNDALLRDLDALSNEYDDMCDQRDKWRQRCIMLLVALIADLVWRCF